MKIFDLSDKTAIVVGGSKGLGKGMAMGLSKAGANLVICSRNQRDLDAAAETIRKETGGNVLTISSDITSLDGINSVVSQTISEFNHIDILINSAGVNVRKNALEFNEDDWDIVQDTQLKYVFFMCQAVARHMVEKGIKGKLINIASLTSQLGLKNMVSYCCAKGGIVQLTKALSNEFAEYGINVNAIGPGYYKTEMTKVLFENKEYLDSLLSRIPMNHTGVPEDLEGAAVYLASKASDYMTGQVLYIDGGWLSS